MEVLHYLIGGLATVFTIAAFVVATLLVMDLIDLW